jgi:DNA-binding response OmpR family regulator
MAKVALVEDDESMRSLMGTLLELEGFQIAALYSDCGVEETQQDLRTAHPDVAVIDVHLRLFSGLELLRRLKADPVLASTRVLMISGMDLGYECRMAGADDFLMKPFMPDDLMSGIRRLSSGSPGAGF